MCFSCVRILLKNCNALKRVAGEFFFFLAFFSESGERSFERAQPRQAAPLKALLGRKGQVSTLRDIKDKELIRKSKGSRPLEFLKKVFVSKGRAVRGGNHELESWVCEGLMCVCTTDELAIFSQTEMVKNYQIGTLFA